MASLCGDNLLTRLSHKASISDLNAAIILAEVCDESLPESGQIQNILVLIINSPVVCGG